MLALQAKSDGGESIYRMLRERVSVERAGRTQFGWRMPKGARKNCGELRRMSIN